MKTLIDLNIPGVFAAWNDPISDFISDWLDFSHTHPAITSSSLEALKNATDMSCWATLNKGGIMMDAASKLDTIGWSHLVKGHVSQKWGTQQGTHH